MKAKEALFYLAAVLLCGCVPVFSLNGLYTEKDVVFEQDLLGTWADPNDPEGAWQFTRNNQVENAYRLTLESGDGPKGLFDAHLLKLENKLFLDVYPAREGFEQNMAALEEAAEDPNNKVWAFNLIFAVPVHTFLRIDSVKPALKMRLTDDELMKKLLQQDPKAVEHVLADERRFVLTASTKKLQAFVLKYADDERLFGNRITLERRRDRDRPRRGGRGADDR